MPKGFFGKAAQGYSSRVSDQLSQAGEVSGRVMRKEIENLEAQQRAYESELTALERSFYPAQGNMASSLAGAMLRRDEFPAEVYPSGAVYDNDPGMAAYFRDVKNTPQHGAEPQQAWNADDKLQERMAGISPRERANLQDAYQGNHHDADSSSYSKVRARIAEQMNGNHKLLMEAERLSETQRSMTLKALETQDGIRANTHYDLGVGKSDNLVVDDELYMTTASHLEKTDRQTAQVMLEIAKEVEDLCRTDFVVPDTLPRVEATLRAVYESFGQYQELTGEMAQIVRKLVSETGAADR